MSKTSIQLKRKRLPVQGGEHDDPLLEAWQKTLLENGGRAAILDVRGNVVRTFDQVQLRADEFVRELGSVSTGDVIAIQIGNHPDWPSLFLACLRKRLVVFPLEQTMSGEQQRAAFETCRVVAAAVLGGSGVRVERGRTAATTAPAATMPLRGKRPSLLKLTSGTTAAPRAIRFRSEQLLADCENICDTMGITARDVNFGVIPISHSYGFSNLLTPLLLRGIALALSNDRLPRAILDGMAASGATVFPGMPVFYQSLCGLSETPALPKLRLCISAGAPLNVELAQMFKAKFGRAIHSFYGSSECGGICYACTPRPIAGFVGEAMCGVEIEFIEERPASAPHPNFLPGGEGTTHAASTRIIGAISVRSAAVGDGYFPEPDEARLGPGIFRPDDVLEKTPQGYRVVGRVSDVINVAGKKVSPAQVEAEMLRCAGVLEAVVFGRESSRRNEEVAACVVASGVSEAELLAHCRARLSPWQTPRRIFFVDGIPVNERGKISRRELARKYSVGS